ncbi:MerR family DNA-binding transcriptional regulator [Nonomuraea glycinis]|uniref:MerR family DNA-binding transcriptional regulator n=1 Tax=Nonomuraea glycinis TaxID=2047744 RepID=UPI002E14CBB8|nr:MerR family DNA-binding transcriptional regulator [Nonomuraea glycinis]
MHIGELARRTGVSVRALRYYEEQGLLVPARAANGYREYTKAAVDVVGCIQLLYAAGLSSAKVAGAARCVPRRRRGRAVRGADRGTGNGAGAAGRRDRGASGVAAPA